MRIWRCKLDISELRQNVLYLPSGHWMLNRHFKLMSYLGHNIADQYVTWTGCQWHKFNMYLTEIMCASHLNLMSFWPILTKIWRTSDQKRICPTNPNSNDQWLTKLWHVSDQSPAHVWPKIWHVSDQLWPKPAKCLTKNLTCFWPKHDVFLTRSDQNPTCFWSTLTKIRCVFDLNMTYFW